MKIKHVLISILIPFICNSEEKPYFIYGDMQALGLYPLIGGGVRVQKEIHAFDFSTNFCPFNPSIFHIKSLYLIYPQQRGFYAGGGLGILNDPETINRSGSFEIAIGYQWGNRFFLEADVLLPFKHAEGLSPVCPGLTFGVSF